MGFLSIFSTKFFAFKQSCHTMRHYKLLEWTQPPYFSVQKTCEDSRKVHWWMVIGSKWSKCVVQKCAQNNVLGTNSGCSSDFPWLSKEAKPVLIKDTIFNVFSLDGTQHLVALERACWRKKCCIPTTSLSALMLSNLRSAMEWKMYDNLANLGLACKKWALEPKIRTMLTGRG